MATDPSGRSPVEREQTFIFHLIELRARLLRCILCVALFFLVLGYFANDIYRLVASPALEHLRGNNAMIATEVGSAFFAPLKLAFYLSLYVAMPYILFQAWAFIAPGLYDNERRFALPLLISSILLFYAGILFAFFIVFPVFFGFMAATAPADVAIMTDISRYLDFVLSMFLAFGLAFEVPVLTILLVWSGIVSTAALRRYRPYIIIIAFVIGAILTPPDVLSQTLLSVPLWLLFEVGLLMATRFEDRRSSEQAQPILPP